MLMQALTVLQECQQEKDVRVAVVQFDLVRCFSEERGLSDSLMQR
jgi:hypothetical protein